MHGKDYYDASVSSVWRNEEESEKRREAMLLEYWRNGKTARQAARETGVPEGTTYYYYKKFNKDPARANRLAKSLRPSQNLGALDHLEQSTKALATEEVTKKYESLMNEGKFVEAKQYLEAEQVHDRYRSQQLSDVTSDFALYYSAPTKYRMLIPQVLEEVLSMDEGGTNPPAADSEFQLLCDAISTRIPEEQKPLFLAHLRKRRRQFDLDKKAVRTKLKSADSHALPDAPEPILDQNSERIDRLIREFEKSRIKDKK
jgi:transposase